MATGVKAIATTCLYRSLLLLHIFQSWSVVSCTKIRGVAITKLPFYDPSRGTFSCFDGSLTVPFTSVNDDYCDCVDASDEPGTPACPNGKFHCTNPGYIPRNIPSSRVNDGICDCCDGTDEYDGKVNCENSCKILGKELMEKRKRDQEVAAQGYTMKQEYSQQGQEKKVEYKQKLDELKTTLEDKKTNSDDLKGKKEAAESLEKDAKDKHQQWWDEEKAKRQAERERVEAERVFSELDVDSSGSVSSKEIAECKLLDKTYTEEEAKELLGGVEEISQDQFVAEVWKKSFKDKYVGEVAESEEKAPDEDTSKEDTDEAPAEPPPDLNPDDHLNLPEPEDDEEDEDEEEEEVEDEIKAEAKRRSEENIQDKDVPKPEDSTVDDEPMPDYDEATKALIDAADKARKEFEEAEKNQKDVEREISAIEKMLNIDFGEHEEFYPLHGQCYEFTDREYKYKLCPFKEVTQQPKSGGVETNLGFWEAWSGQQDKYSQMKYAGGLGCWNGPNRSTVVNLSCGPANELVQSTEPNRCEYLMEFKTPAACHPVDQQIHEHQEL